MEYWWNMNGILVVYQWNIGGISMGYWWNIYIYIETGYDWNINGLRLES